MKKKNPSNIMLLCLHTQTTEALGLKSVFRCEQTIQTLNIVPAGKSPTHMAAAEAYSCGITRSWTM